MGAVVPLANLGRVSTTTDEQLEAASWDLEPLVEGRGAEAVEQMLVEARERAQAFSERYRGRVAELEVDELAEAMEELAAIHDLGGRAGSYAVLSYSLDTADPERGALLQKARELGASIETELLFFDLEWNPVPDERAEELLAAPELEFAAHHLRTLRRYRPHQLSEPEERVLTETNVTGGSAFQRLFTEQTSALEVPLPDRDEPAALEEGLSLLQDPDRERRAEAAAAVTESLRPGLRTRAFVFNNLLQDKATKDRLRGYPHWLASRNLANEASDESVQALIEAVQGRYDLARRWYSLKARLLGLDRLAYYDRMAPVSDSDDRIPYGESRGDRARLLPDLLAGARRDGRGVLPRRLHRRAAAARQARRRVLLVHRPLGAPVRDAELHVAPARRARDGPRARARRARLAGAAAGHLPLLHAADARRDGVDLRREHRPRATARAGARGRPSGSTCSRAPSTARWRQCSARSR